MTCAISYAADREAASEETGLDGLNTGSEETDRDMLNAGSDGTDREMLKEGSEVTDREMLQAEFDSLPLKGRLPVPMTNDYLFRAMLQESDIILKGLLSSLLSIPVEEITEARIENPIVLGEQIDNKTFILDVLISLNNKKRINIELQVINEHNWVDRSLTYLCRTFSGIERSKDYSLAQPVHQIGILNYTLFPDLPEFYANYEILNISSHERYSDKLRISVLDLTKADLATQRDKDSGLWSWAKLFKIRTWEELRKMAENNDVYKSVATHLRKLTHEERIRMQCEAREDYYKTQNDFHGFYKRELAEKMAEKDQIISEKDREISEKDRILAEKEKMIAELEEKLRALDRS